MISAAEDLERIRRSCLMDDAYMTKFFAGNTACVELVLRIIMEKEDLTVKTVRTQKTLRGANRSRSVRLDIHAADGEGREYDIEIQRASAGASPRRARFHSALLDVNILKAKQDFDELRESVVIFITEEDVLGDGEPIYIIQRTIQKTGRIFGDGSLILYVNASNQDEGTTLGRLMHDFTCADAEKMHYPLLAERTRFFKENRRGLQIMSGVWDEMRKESIKEGMEQGIEKGRSAGIQEERESVVLRMLRAGKLALKEIAEYSGLTLNEVKAIQRGMA